MTNRCTRCGGLGCRYTLPGKDVMKLTVTQLLTARFQKTKCNECEGTGRAAPLMNLSELRERMQVAS